MLAAASAADGHVQQAPSAAVQQDKAAALAELVAGTEVTLSLELGFAKQAFDAVMATDADLKTMIDENPGLQAAVWAAVEPEIRRSSIEGNPAFLARIAALYRSRLTATELDAVYAFFEGPTGQKLVKAMYGGINPQPVIAEAMAGSGDISGSAIVEAADAGRTKALSTIGPEDEPALATLTRAVSTQKLQALGAEVQKLTLDYVNEDDPVLDAKIEAVIEAAFRDYFAKQDAAD